MMKPMPWLTALVVSPLLFSMSVGMVLPVAAQPTPGTPPINRGEGRPRPRFDREIWDQLDLTPSQRQKLAELRRQHEPQADRAALRTEMDKLRQMMAGTADAAQIRAQHENVQTIRQRLELQRLDMLLAIREILTPDQRQALEQLRAERPRLKDPQPRRPEAPPPPPLDDLP
ncbi:MAG: hypothetical protein OHK0012_03790 [Synechococcales cyanobacterium]